MNSQAPEFTPGPRARVQPLALNPQAPEFTPQHLSYARQPRAPPVANRNSAGNSLVFTLELAAVVPTGVRATAVLGTLEKERHAKTKGQEQMVVETAQQKRAPRVEEGGKADAEAQKGVGRRNSREQDAVKEPNEAVVVEPAAQAGAAGRAEDSEAEEAAKATEALEAADAEGAQAVVGEAEQADGSEDVAESPEPAANTLEAVGFLAPSADANNIFGVGGGAGQNSLVEQDQACRRPCLTPHQFGFGIAAAGAAMISAATVAVRRRFRP